MKRKVWNATAYALLYEQLVTRFGPLDMWDSNSRPGRGLNKEYQTFLICISTAAALLASQASANDAGERTTDSKLSRRA